MRSILTDLDAVPAILTLLAVGLLVYTYLGYPVLLWIVGKLRAPLNTVSGEPTSWPTVTVIISAHNEEAVISRRIRNLLEQDYPQGCLKILIGSDGSTDGTHEEVARYRFAKVRLAAFAERRGKANVLNDLVAMATGEYLVFTDAATIFYPDSIRQLVTGFHRYPTAAVIGGELELRCPETSGNADGLYWRYEMFLKTNESRVGAGLGASGAIYAIRRKDYRPLPPQTMADDLLEPMLIRLHTKGDVVLHSGARAWQVTPIHVADEFHRRVRTGGGIFHVLLETWRLLLPQWGTVALAYWSHKTLRLLGPWILLIALVGNVWALNHWGYQVLFVVQATVYGLGISAGRVRVIPVVGKVAVAARYFLVLNAALAVGCLKFMFGMARPTWDRTQRVSEHVVIPAAWPELKPQKAADEHRPAA
jgi:cellulose synthase/poly-beta-1,6-N-acetylglucosamine synthase-like glycosyltransferase